MNNYKISELYIYPVKSLGGFSVEKAKVTDRGFEYDRRWMLVDSENKFLSQRSIKKMSLLGTRISNDSLTVYNKTKPTDEISVPLSTSGLELNEALVWDEKVYVKSYGNQINEWFSDQLQMDCRLVYMPDETHRPVDQRFSINNNITSLSDGYPFLILGQESLNLLNSKLEVTLPMNRFRPNLVFTGGRPHDEDNWEKFSIDGIIFQPVKPCARCIVTTVNQETGEQGTEPLKTLTTYRGAENNKVLFGMNLLHEGSGFINVGDDIIF